MAFPSCWPFNFSSSSESESINNSDQIPLINSQASVLTLDKALKDYNAEKPTTWSQSLAKVGWVLTAAAMLGQGIFASLFTYVLLIKLVGTIPTLIASGIAGFTSFEGKRSLVQYFADLFHQFQNIPATVKFSLSPYNWTVLRFVTFALVANIAKVFGYLGALSFIKTAELIRQEFDGDTASDAADALGTVYTYAFFVFSAIFCNLFSFSGIIKAATGMLMSAIKYAATDPKTRQDREALHFQIRKVAGNTILRELKQLEKDKFAQAPNLVCFFEELAVKYDAKLNENHNENKKITVTEGLQLKSIRNQSGSIDFDALQQNLIYIQALQNSNDDEYEFEKLCLNESIREIAATMEIQEIKSMLYQENTNTQIKFGKQEEGEDNEINYKVVANYQTISRPEYHGENSKKFWLGHIAGFVSFATAAMGFYNFAPMDVAANEFFSMSPISVVTEPMSLIAMTMLALATAYQSGNLITRWCWNKFNFSSDSENKNNPQPTADWVMFGIRAATFIVGVIGGLPNGYQQYVVQSSLIWLVLVSLLASLFAELHGMYECRLSDSYNRIINRNPHEPNWYHKRVTPKNYKEFAIAQRGQVILGNAFDSAANTDQGYSDFQETSEEGLNSNQSTEYSFETTENSVSNFSGLSSNTGSTSKLQNYTTKFFGGLHQLVERVSNIPVIGVSVNEMRAR